MKTFLATLGYLLVMQFVSYIVSKILKKFNITHSKNIMVNLMFDSKLFSLLFLCDVFIIPLIDEIVFRLIPFYFLKHVLYFFLINGVLYPLYYFLDFSFKKIEPSTKCHRFIFEIVQHIFLGLTLALYMYQFQSILGCMFLHMAHNFLHATVF